MSTYSAFSLLLTSPVANPPTLFPCPIQILTFRIPLGSLLWPSQQNGLFFTKHRKIFDFLWLFQRSSTEDLLREGIDNASLILTSLWSTGKNLARKDLFKAFSVSWWRWPSEHLFTNICFHLCWTAFLPFEISNHSPPFPWTRGGIRASTGTSIRMQN